MFYSTKYIYSLILLFRSIMMLYQICCQKIFFILKCFAKILSILQKFMRENNLPLRKTKKISLYFFSKEICIRKKLLPCVQEIFHFSFIKKKIEQLFFPVFFFFFFLILFFSFYYGNFLIFKLYFLPMFLQS